MHVVIGGASGFLGTALVAHLREHGHQVTRLVRTDDPPSDASLWDPRTGRLDQIVIDRADAVVNLSGSSVGRWPRTGRVRRELLASRIDATTTLARAVAASENKPALLSGSAMGTTAPIAATRSSPRRASPARDSCPRSCSVGRRRPQPAVDAGARVCMLRTTLPLDRSGGLLKPLVPVFKLGARRRLGTGRQYMAMVVPARLAPRRDVPGREPDASGPFNIGMPQATDQRRVHRRAGRGTAAAPPCSWPRPSSSRAVLGGWPTTCSARCASTRCGCARPASRSTTPTSRCARAGACLSRRSRPPTRPTRHSCSSPTSTSSATKLHARSPGLMTMRSTPARCRPGWTPRQLVNHLVHMERRWFVWGFLGEHIDDPWGDRDADGTWHTDAGVEELIDQLRAGGSRTTEILRDHALVDPSATTGRFADTDEAPTLMGVAFHVFQEYARHVGHLDIVRELTDGQTRETDSAPSHGRDPPGRPSARARRFAGSAGRAAGHGGDRRPFAPWCGRGGRRRRASASRRAIEDATRLPHQQHAVEPQPALAVGARAPRHRRGPRARRRRPRSGARGRPW